MNLRRVLALSTICVASVQSFSPSRVNQNAGRRFFIHRSEVKKVPLSKHTALSAKITEAELKEELGLYLKKREELKADEVAKA